MQLPDRYSKANHRRIEIFVLPRIFPPRPSRRPRRRWWCTMRRCCTRSSSRRILRSPPRRVSHASACRITWRLLNLLRRAAEHRLALCNLCSLSQCSCLATRLLCSRPLCRSAFVSTDREVLGPQGTRACAVLRCRQQMALQDWEHRRPPEGEIRHHLSAQRERATHVCFGPFHSRG